TLAGRGECPGLLPFPWPDRPQSAISSPRGGEETEDGTARDWSDRLWHRWHRRGPLVARTAPAPGRPRRPPPSPPSRLRAPPRQRPRTPHPPEFFSTDLETILRDPDIHVAVELVGGVDWARDAVLRLLEAGKDVVTANKALLATHGVEVFNAARQHGPAIAFEGSGAGRIPTMPALP